MAKFKDDEHTKIWSEGFGEQDFRVPDREENTRVYEGADSDGTDSEETVLLKKDRRSNVVAWLVVFRGKKTEGKYDLTQNDYLIGRGKYCDIILDDEDQELSRLHGRIRFDEVTKKYMYFDCGSANGSKINDTEVQTKELEDNDKIIAGPYTLIFKKI
jgi:pSer/pThr/pTyr-binding forkhead associated (FHA) protein